MLQAFQRPVASHKDGNSTTSTTKHGYLSSTSSYPTAGNTGNSTNIFSRRGYKGHSRLDIMAGYLNVFTSPTDSVDSTAVTVTQVAVVASSSLNTGTSIMSTSIMSASFETIFTKPDITSEASATPTRNEGMPPAAIWTPEKFSSFNNGQIHRTDEFTILTVVNPASATLGVSSAVPTDLTAAGMTASVDEHVPAAPLKGAGRISQMNSYLSINGAESSEDSVIIPTSSFSVGEQLPSYTPATLTSATRTEIDPEGVGIETETLIVVTPTATIHMETVLAAPTSSPLHESAGPSITPGAPIAATSGESQIPNEEANTNTGNLPFPTNQAIPSSLLTVTESGLTSTPAQGLGASVLASIASAQASTFPSASASASAVVASSFTLPPSQVHSMTPTVLPTSAPTPIPPSTDNSKRKLSISLGVSLSVLFLAILTFLIFWLRTRRIERKKIDELEKNVEWLKPPPRKVSGSNSSAGTLMKMTNLDGAGAKIVEPQTLSPAKTNNSETPRSGWVNPLEKQSLNDEEIRLARAYGMLEDLEAETSARSPRHTAKRRSAGSNLACRWVDGAVDTPEKKRSSSSPPKYYPRNFEPAYPDPFDDVNAIDLPPSEIGIAVTTDMDTEDPLEYSPALNRNTLTGYMPTRLSTISDRSEFEMQEFEMQMQMQMPRGGEAVITDGGHARGRLLEHCTLNT